MKKGFRILKFKKDKPIFEVKDVSKSFDGRPILKKLSLKVFPGECVGVLGPNGCGKTTLFSMCIGEQNVEGGKIYLNNKSIEQIEEAIMSALFNTPPALSADIYNEGLYLTGGGSMLRGLDKRISRKTKLPVYVAEDPLRAVARGTGIALKNTENYTFLIR